MKTTKQGVVWEIVAHRVAFTLTFVVFLAISYIFLFSVGATPDPAGDTTAVIAEDTTSGVGADTLARDATYTTPASVNTPEAPLRVVAKSINLDTSVSNPTSTDNDVLDAALAKGAIRYPTSATLGVDGTVLLFGHSSYLPIVHNQAYKTFDGIQNLKEGDVVSVYSAAHEYQYKVVGVRIANAEQDGIDLSTTGRHLTLVTCDSFASKSHRFVVTADLAATFGVGR